MYRKFTGSRIIIAVGLLLLWTTMVMSSGPISPARPLAAAAAATPDCSGIDTYRQQLGMIRDDYRAAFLERLPGVQPDWEITGGMDTLEAALIKPGADYGLSWTSWLMQRSKEQLTTLSELWGERANQIRALQPPTVAQALHEELISGTESLADLYQLASEEGAMMAMLTIMLSGDDGTPSMAELSDALVEACPAWAAYQGGSMAAPVPKSRVQTESPASDSLIVVGSLYGLYAIDRDSGMQRWHFPAGNTKDSTPAIAGATVYVGNDAGVLFAVDANSGRELWRRDFGKDRQVWSPTVADGIVFVAAEIRPNGSLAARSPEGRAWALDAATGEERWAFPTEEEVTTTPAFADGVVFVSVRYDHIYAIVAESGRQLWAYPIQGEASDPVSANGRLYVQVGTVMQVLDTSTGNQLWAEWTSAVSAEATPAIANGMLFLVSHGASGYDRYTEHLVALGAAAGEQRWSAELEGELNPVPRVESGIVYIAGDICTHWHTNEIWMTCDGTHVTRFYALDAESGDVLWSLDVPGELLTDPVISGNLAILQDTSSMLSGMDLDTGTVQWTVSLIDLLPGLG